MEPDQPSPSDYSQPVAYDAEGRPLYVHPPVRVKANMQMQAARMIRSTEPMKPIISDEVKLKHNRSKKIFPDLDLSEGEYVVSAIQRHPIGLFVPLTIGVSLVALSFTVLFNYDLIAKEFKLNDDAMGFSVIIFPVIIFMISVILGTYIAYYIYINNKLFLTNESVIQEIQTGLFSKSGQAVSLVNIEDVSYTQNGIIQQIFDYGSIKLSIESESATYKFTYVENPKGYIAVLNKAIEAFKNGRTVE